MKIGEYEIQVPFVTTAADTVKDLFILLDKKKISQAVDLGSGDGRVLLELGKHGITSVGYEIKQPLVEKTKKRIQEAKLTNVDVFCESFWDISLQEYDLIYIYGMSSVMGRLEEKLDKEATKGTIVITNVFPLPHWRVKKQKNYLHYYIKG